MNTTLQMYKTILLISFGLFFASSVTAQTTFTVNSNGDKGNEAAGNGQCFTGDTITVDGVGEVNECTLRAALEEANEASGEVIIEISSSIPLAVANGYTAIGIQSALPTINNQVTIAGETHPSFDEDDEIPMLVIQGSQAGNSVDGLRIGSGGGNSEIRYISVIDFDRDAVNISAAENVRLESNYLGRASSVLTWGNGRDGVHLRNGASNNLIINNTILANDGSGVRITFNATSNVLSGNNIGLYYEDGEYTVNGNDQRGVNITSTAGSGNRVGLCLFSTCTGNNIAGNGMGGMIIAGEDQYVQANLIGVGPEGSGDERFGNEGIGIIIAGNAHTIGGSSENRGNIVGNSDGHGIAFIDSITEDTEIRNNVVGVTSTGAAAGNNGHGVRILGNDGTIIRGNKIMHSEEDGVYVHSSTVGAIIIENEIYDNGRNGIYTAGQAFIGGESSEPNYIGGNEENGILIEGEESQVLGAVIGSGPAGNGRGNGADGIRISTSSIQIGNNTDEGANRIVYNEGHGISITGNYDDLIIYRNFIGTDESGTDKGNHNRGIESRGNTDIAGNIIRFNLQGVYQLSGSMVVYANTITDHESSGIHVSTNAIIGGAGNSYRNIIGNNSMGIRTNTTFGEVNILGNYIGTNLDGEDLGNNRGIWVDSGNNVNIGNTVGAADGRAANVIVNNVAGIGLMRPENTLIQGNYIGVTRDGTVMGNENSGIHIWGIGSSGTDNNIIGYAYDDDIPNESHPSVGGLGNVIAYTNGHGVRFDGSDDYSLYSNTIRGNHIFANEGRGIYLSETSNEVDPGGASDGPNSLQNFPDFDNASTVLNSAGTQVNYSFKVDTDAVNADYPLKVDLYLADGDQRQGSEYIGTVIYEEPDAGSFVGGTLNLPSGVNPERFDYIVATATDAEGNTSEFSEAIILAEPANIIISDQSIDFGELTVGESNEYDIIISNSGEVALNGELSLADGQSNPFEIDTEEKKFMVEESETAWFTVSIESDETGVKEGILLIEHDAPNKSSPIEVPLQAEFILPVPESVTLLAPENNAVDVSLTPEFTWEESGYAETYRIRVMDDATDAVVYTADEITGTVYTIDKPFEKETLYNWSVKAVNESGESSWGGHFTFTTYTELSVPEPVVLLSPTDGAEEVSLAPEIEWEAVSGADSYELQLAEDGQFSVILNDMEGLPETVYEVQDDLNEVQTYYWRVRAENEAGTGEWSDIWSFTTERKLPGAIVLESPEDGAADVGLEPVYTWGEDASADSYQIMVAEDASFEVLVENISDLKEPEMASNYTLEERVTFYWRVRAVNDAGNGEWSEVSSFTTGMGTSVDDSGEIADFALHQNYPNPFNPTTQVEFSTPEASHVSIAVYNMIGRQVAVLVDDNMSPGRHSVTFDASGLSSGTYIYRMEAGNVSKVRKLTLIK